MRNPLDRLEFKDKVITCVDCDCEFTFEAGEQRYFMSKGLSVPKRCSECRKVRRMSIIREVEYNG